MPQSKSSFVSIAVLLLNSIIQCEAMSTAGTWEYLNRTMPKPISDMTATYVPQTKRIYIFGGCDATTGNSRADFDPNLFICTGVSSDGFIFNPVDKSFDSVIMPRERYRHAASVVNEQIYLVGGRDLEDNIILDVDVYDVVNKTWSTPFVLNKSIAKSDFGMFPHENRFLYLVGGYEQDYTASKSVYKFDTISKSVEEVAPMIEARGDIFAEHDGFAAFVTGGFTHEDGFCQAKSTTEKYLILDNEWEEMDSMNMNRGDQAVVSLGEYLFALGGEYKDDCTSDPAESTVASDSVDVLNLDVINPQWTKLDDIPDDRFRFTGESDPDLNTIFIFGGQKFYDPDCECYPTSDAILGYKLDTVALKDLTHPSGTSPSSAGFSLMDSTSFWRLSSFQNLIGFLSVFGGMFMM